MIWNKYKMKFFVFLLGFTKTSINKTIWWFRNKKREFSKELRAVIG